MAMGGLAKPVHVISDSDLRENGGNYKLKSGAAIKVTGFSTPDKVAGGKLQAVYVVPDGFPVQGGESVKVTNAIEVADRGLQGGLVATPIHVVNGDEWPFEYLIRDEFTDTVAAGSVNGTSATPGPAVRNAYDPENKMFIAGGSLVWSEQEISNNNHCACHWGTITRSPGVSMHVRARYTSVDGQWHLTLDESDGRQAAGTGEVQLRLQGPEQPIRFICGDLNDFDLSDTFSVQNAWDEYAIVLKTAGAILYRWNGSSWDLVIERNDGTETTLYVKFSNLGNIAGASAGELNFIRVTTQPPTGIPIPA